MKSQSAASMFTEKALNETVAQPGGEFLIYAATIHHIHIKKTRTD